MDFVPFIKKLNERGILNNTNIGKDMGNGYSNKKPSALAIIATLGVLLTLFINLTGVGDRIFHRGGASAVMAQDVKNLKEDVKTLENDVGVIKKEVTEDDKNIALMQKDVENMDKTVTQLSEAVAQFMAAQTAKNAKYDEHIIKENN